MAVKASDDQPSDQLRILPTDDKKTVNLKKKKVCVMAGSESRCICYRRRSRPKKRTTSLRANSPRGSNSRIEHRTRDELSLRRVSFPIVGVSLHSHKQLSRRIASSAHRREPSERRELHPPSGP